MGSQYEEDLAFIHRHVSVDEVMSRAANHFKQVEADVRSAIDMAGSPKDSWLATALPNLYLNLELLLNRARQPREELREILERSLDWESKLTGFDSPASEEKRSILRVVQDG